MKSVKTKVHLAPFLSYWLKKWAKKSFNFLPQKWTKDDPLPMDTVKHY